MFVISTRNFPPEIGGMQNLMGGLSLSLLKYGPVKVFDSTVRFHRPRQVGNYGLVGEALITPPDPDETPPLHRFKGTDIHG